jgi:hypothetical protein
VSGEIEGAMLGAVVQVTVDQLLNAIRAAWGSRNGDAEAWPAVAALDRRIVELLVEAERAQALADPKVRSIETARPRK